MDWKSIEIGEESLFLLFGVWLLFFGVINICVGVGIRVCSGVGFAQFFSMFGQGYDLLLYFPLFDSRRIIKIQIIDRALLHEPKYHLTYDIDRNKIAMKAIVSQKSTLLS